MSHLCSLGWPGRPTVTQAGLTGPASAFPAQIIGVTTMPGGSWLIFMVKPNPETLLKLPFYLFQASHATHPSSLHFETGSH